MDMLEKSHIKSIKSYYQSIEESVMPLLDEQKDQRAIDYLLK